MYIENTGPAQVEEIFSKRNPPARGWNPGCLGKFRQLMTRITQCVAGRSLKSLAHHAASNLSKDLVLATFPQLFSPHPHLSDEVNHNIAQSEVEGGVVLHHLAATSVLHIQTQHHCYTLIHCGENRGLISGHPEFCPRPVAVRIAGSTWGGSMLKRHFIGRGMRLAFKHPQYETPIVTSRILEIWECARIRKPTVVAKQPERRALA